MTSFRFRMLATAISIATLATPAFAQELANEGPLPTRALISVQTKGNEKLNAAALQLQVNGHDAEISSVSSVAKQGAQVAILIDDGLRGNFGVQIEEIKRFITTLPPYTQVLVGYMQNGTVRSNGTFSADHAAIARQVRIPLSSPGISASPYFCLQDFVKHWPGQGDAARMVLMLTNGVDLYNGSVSPLNQDSPYVQRAQDDAQRAGVAVYSIYYGDSGIRGGLANFSGQSYLNQVAEATGGESFYQGRITPPSLAPYLDEFRNAISESLVVGFNAPVHEHHNTLTRIKIKSDQPGVRIHAPQSVRAGAVEEARE